MTACVSDGLLIVWLPGARIESYAWQVYQRGSVTHIVPVTSKNGHVAPGDMIWLALAEALFHVASSAENFLD